MAHVAEHHGEEEGEGDDGIGCCGRGRAQPGPRGEAPSPGSGTAPHSNFFEHSGTPQNAPAGWLTLARGRLAGLQTLNTVHLPRAAPSLHGDAPLQARKLQLREAKNLIKASESDLNASHSCCPATAAWATPCQPPLGRRSWGDRE